MGRRLFRTAHPRPLGSAGTAAPGPVVLENLLPSEDLSGPRSGVVLMETVQVYYPSKRLLSRGPPLLWRFILRFMKQGYNFQMLIERQGPITSFGNSYNTRMSSALTFLKWKARKTASSLREATHYFYGGALGLA